MRMEKDGRNYEEIEGFYNRCLGCPCYDMRGFWCYKYLKGIESIKVCADLAEELPDE